MEGLATKSKEKFPIYLKERLHYLEDYIGSLKGFIERKITISDEQKAAIEGEIERTGIEIFNCKIKLESPAYAKKFKKR